MSVSPDWDVFSPYFESRAKLYKAMGGMAGQMGRRGCVYLIDAETKEGGSGRKVSGVSGSWGRGEHVEQRRNHRHICCSSRMFPMSSKRFLQPCESALSCQEGRGFVFDFFFQFVCL